MIKEFFLYQISEPAVGAFDHFMGGLYLIKGVPLFIQLAVLMLYPLALGLLLQSDATQNEKSKSNRLMLSQFCSIVAFSLNSILLFTPWDESFINLRHSFNLAHHNFFSFNLNSASEGTADFLVFFVLGLMGKLGLPLFELLFFQAWLGGVLCVWAIHKIAIFLQIPKADKWSLFIATIFPTLMLNSSHGFATSLFSAAILWVFYFLFFKRELIPGFIVLSLVPLIRWEGFWFLALCYAFILRDSKYLRAQFNSVSIGALLTLLPTVALMLYRLKSFGSWIPVPVIYKSSIGNPFYLVLGFRNLFLDLISTLAFAFILPILMKLLSDKKLTQNNGLITPLMILILFSLPYYLSGGDWFPPAWGRYLLPLTLYLGLVAWKIISQIEKTKSNPLLLTFVFGIIICAAAPTSSLIRVYELMFSHGSALLSLNLKKRTENPTYRPHYLSQLGFHLKNSTNPSDRIGSSELATLMYYSERDAVDFLGLTDLKLAHMPLRKTPAFARKNPKAAELPLLIFKRIAPERVAELKPEYLYLFDFMIEILMDQKNTSDWNDHDYFKALHRWEAKFKDLVTPLYGGVGQLLELGYIPIVVSYDHDFCALYFVRQDHLSIHQKRLSELGLIGRKITE